jgi:hypothetical protein
MSRTDFSHGTFFEGCVTVATQEEAKQLEENFTKTGVLTLHEATNRYLSRKVASETSTLQFLNPDASQNFRCASYLAGSHCFGQGFTTKDKNNYTYYYWLEISVKPETHAVNALRDAAKARAKPKCLRLCSLAMEIATENEQQDDVELVALLHGQGDLEVPADCSHHVAELRARYGDVVHDAEAVAALDASNVLTVLAACPTVRDAMPYLARALNVRGRTMQGQLLLSRRIRQVQSFLAA